MSLRRVVRGMTETFGWGVVLLLNLYDRHKQSRCLVCGHECKKENR